MISPSHAWNSIEEGGEWGGWGGIRLGQWSRWSAIDKGWFLLKRRTFACMCTLTHSPRTKIKMSWQTCIGRLGSVGFQDTSRNKMRIPVTSCLADWAFSSLPWRGILLDTPVHIRKYITAVSWKVAHTPQLPERETYKHLLFWSLPWDKIPLILLWCFHSSKTGQWPGSFSFYSLWVTAFTAPSAATLLQELEGK